MRVVEDVMGYSSGAVRSSTPAVRGRNAAMCGEGDVYDGRENSRCPWCGSADRIWLSRVFEIAVDGVVVTRRGGKRADG
jgi:hypothetical protein